ncbi:hypothetical protein FJO69_01410 [[Mycoplasma] falconis]|uniref:Lipoprotein n=1 Tax=[Mycoplasma] falconis TaxID=92403 RepID=A0A501XAK7_9BACT|nr:aromatic motif membrane protein [[Mycoplasma] falconis]TPE57572.1 hypothetical protein FJO69_01410 [[Mycoplasma] falconis]
MKKWLLTNVLSLTLLSTPLVTIACQKEKKDEEKPLSNNSYLKKVKSDKQFQNNKNIQNLLNLFEKDKNKQDQLVNNQNNFPDAMFKELSYAMEFFPPFLIQNSDLWNDFQRIIQKSKGVVVETLTKNWYWYLKNIEKFVFTYNPYGDNYGGELFDENRFWNVKKILNGFSLKLNSNVIQDIVKLPWYNEKLNEYKTLDEREVYYLIIDTNKAVGLYTWKQNGETKFYIAPDVLYFNQAKNINETKQEIANLNELITNQIIKSSEKWLNYEILLEDQPYNMSEEEFKESYKKKFYAKRNDASFIKPFNNHAYAEIINQALETYNQEDFKAIRLTWRTIDEK